MILKLSVRNRNFGVCWRMFSLNSLVGIEFKYWGTVGSRRFTASDENMFEIGSVVILIRLPAESTDTVDTMKIWCDELVWKLCTLT